MLVLVYFTDDYLNELYRDTFFTSAQMNKMYTYGWVLFPIFILHQLIYGFLAIYNACQRFKSSDNGQTDELCTQLVNHQEDKIFEVSQPTEKHQSNPESAHASQGAQNGVSVSNLEQTENHEEQAEAKDNQ